MTAHNFANDTFQLTAEIRLSFSRWNGGENGRLHTSAVALLRLKDGKWEIDGETAVEFSSFAKSGKEKHMEDAAESVAMRGISHAAVIAMQILPDDPCVRLYKNYHYSTNGLKVA